MYKGRRSRSRYRIHIEEHEALFSLVDVLHAPVSTPHVPLDVAGRDRRRIKEAVAEGSRVKHLCGERLEMQVTKASG
jgi:hypothetical protein